MLSIFQKNTRKAVSLSALIGILLLSGLVLGQQKDKLQRQLSKNQKEIALTQQILKQTSWKKSSTLTQLLAMNRQLEARNSIISEIEEQVENLDFRIVFLEDDIESVRVEMSQMVANFEKLLTEGYKIKKYKKDIQFILNSSSFNEMLRKKHYLDKVLEFKSIQLRLIKAKKRESDLKIDSLKNQKALKITLLESKKSEQNLLENTKIEREKLLNELKGKEKSLKRDLEKKRKQQAKLNALIAQAITTETKTKDQAENNKSLPGAFGASKGLLPWPVSDGYITEYFGVRQHPTLKNVTTQNNGVDMAVPNNSKAKSVYAGKVVAIMKVPGMQNSVLVSHGGYFTVYANLTDVYVSKGDAIEMGDVIGSLVTDNEGKCYLHFEIWKGRNKMNPTRWLEKK